MTPTITTSRYLKLIRTDQDATYRAALELVGRIDEDLRRGTGHYRTRAGILLTTLDETVRAILADNLLMPEEEEAAIWVRVAA